MKKGSMAVKLGWGVAATLAVALFAHAKTMHGIGEFPLACERTRAVAFAKGCET